MSRQLNRAGLSPRTAEVQVSHFLPALRCHLAPGSQRQLGRVRETGTGRAPWPPFSQDSTRAGPGRVLVQVQPSLAAGSSAEPWPDPAGPFLWFSLAFQVWYREDVSHSNPEGSSWSLVDTPGEVVQISCGPHDLLWVTLWEGQALVREGINRNNPKGGSPAPHTGKGRGAPPLPRVLTDGDPVLSSGAK